MADNKKTLKFQMMMSPNEAEVLDDWMFKNRIRSRAEAIRRLCQIALEAQEPTLFNATLAVEFSKAISKVNDSIRKRVRDEELPRAEMAKELEPYLAYIRRSTVQMMSQAGVLLALFHAYSKDGEVSKILIEAKEQIKELKDAGAMELGDENFDRAFAKIFSLDEKR